MEYRQLGRSGLRVSTLTLGTMTFGGAGTTSSAPARPRCSGWAPTTSTCTSCTSGTG